MWKLFVSTEEPYTFLLMTEEAAFYLKKELAPPLYLPIADFEHEDLARKTFLYAISLEYELRKDIAGDNYQTYFEAAQARGKYKQQRDNYETENQITKSS